MPLKITISKDEIIHFIVPFDVGLTPRAYNLIKYFFDAGLKIVVVTCIVSKSKNNYIFPEGVVVNELYDLNITNWKTFVIRLKFKIGRLLISIFHIETKWALGYGIDRFYNAVSNIKTGTIFFFKEQGLGICSRLLKKRGINLIMDFEDWYSEDLLEINRLQRPIELLKKHEKNIISSGVVIMVPSIEMKKGLEQDYGEGKFLVYFNSFNIFPSAFEFEEIKKINLIWFSQTVSFGRGLEEFINILKNIKTPVELQLIGNRNEEFYLKLKSSFNDPKMHLHSYKFFGFLNDNEIDEVITSAHFGLALETSKIKSRDLTITYKCFRYFLNGLPVFCTSTKGQIEFSNIVGSQIEMLSFNNIVSFEDSCVIVEEILSRTITECGFYKKLRCEIIAKAPNYTVDQVLSRNFQVL